MWFGVKLFDPTLGSGTTSDQFEELVHMFFSNEEDQTNDPSLKDQVLSNKSSFSTAMLKVLLQIGVYEKDSILDPQKLYDSIQKEQIQLEILINAI